MDTGSNFAFIDYMNAGGPIMWIILALSVLALAVAFERIIFFAVSSANRLGLEGKFGAAVSRGDMEAARLAVRGSGSMHRLFADALDNWAMDGDGMKAALESRKRSELFLWDKRLPLLETIAKISPLLGLLGTVLGMVDMFGSLHGGGSVSAEAVTGGIWKALFTTVAGLIVAIPVILIHSMLTARIYREEEELERGGDFLLREHAAVKRGKAA